MMPLTVELVYHRSVEVEPLNGFVTDHAEPASYQYPVAVVVSVWGMDALNWLAVKVGGE
jgi:hypothetical protein